MIDKIHHLFWSVALVACTALVVFFWPHRDATAPSAQVSALQTEVNALVQVDKALAASRGSVPYTQQAAVAAVRTATGGGGGFTDTAYAAFLGALGREKTVPTYKVSFTAPTPRPEPPGTPVWFHQAAYNANSEAIKNATLNVKVVPAPVPVSRIQTGYLSDGSAGVLYAARRRGQLDLDLGVTAVNGQTEATAGVGWRFGGTMAGVYVGPMHNFTTHKTAIAGGLTVAF